MNIVNRTKPIYRGFVNLDRVETSFGGREVEVVTVTDSVAMFVYCEETGQAIFAQQLRVPLSGEILEVAAGRLDKEGMPLKELIIHELEEELGVRANDDDIILLNNGQPLALSPGILTERTYLAYVSIVSKQINPENKIYGLESEGEKIKRVFIPIAELQNQTWQDMKTWALVQWVLKMNLVHAQNGGG